jgi:glucose/arabinose dehydrogenase
LFRQLPRVASGENLGGRLAVSAQGDLFVTLGDRREAVQRVRAQDLSYLQGKTVRIRTDGTVPLDNPFAGIKGARPQIWSLGHRNPQGAFVHPDTGALWIAEHGPFGGDEINVIRPGGNYGWPVVTFGCEYDTCAPIGEGTDKSGMQAPLVHWARPGTAPSNLILYTGEVWPEWKGSVFVGALAGRGVWRLALSGEGSAVEVVARELLFTQLGQRIRDIRQGPDGSLYLLTDGDKARVLRVARQSVANQLMQAW